MPATPRKQAPATIFQLLPVVKRLPAEALKPVSQHLGGQHRGTPTMLKSSMLGGEENLAAQFSRLLVKVFERNHPSPNEKGSADAKPPQEPRPRGIREQHSADAPHFGGAVQALPL